MFLGGILINLGSAKYEANQASKAIPILTKGINIANSFGK